MFITKRKIEALSVCNMDSALNFMDAQCKRGFHAKRLFEMATKYISEEYNPMLDYLVVALQLLTKENLRKVYDDLTFRRCVYSVSWERFQELASK